MKAVHNANSKGYVTECSGDNIFYLKNGVITTPPVWIGILPGITRQAVLDIAKETLALEVQENVFTVHDLYTAQEVFISGTGAEIAGVVELDGRVIGKGKPGKLTRDLQKLYHQIASTTGIAVYDKPELIADKK